MYTVTGVRVVEIDYRRCEMPFTKREEFSLKKFVGVLSIILPVVLYLSRVDMNGLVLLVGR
jgi:hypothetical protein